MFPEPTNDTRAYWAELAIEAFEAATRTDRCDAVADLLANLMHFCDRESLDFAAQLNRAASNYQAETED